MAVTKLGILSDIHYASEAERVRGTDYEYRGISNPLTRFLLRQYRRFVWLHRPMEHNGLLDGFINQCGDCDYVIANGDYSCNSGFIGVADPAARQSVRECLGKLRVRYGDRFRATYGDHELGKVSFIGGRGGMRLESWQQAVGELGLEPFWTLRIGRYVLMGVVSSLVALPVFEPDTLETEQAEWHRLRAKHLAEIRVAFEELRKEDRVLLFCHDPTALPFLHREEAVRIHLQQIEQTIIGHLHSNLVLWKARLLAGIPRITFLGHSAKRFSTALREARLWKSFNVRLCPSLAGIELLKDGGYLIAEIDPEARRPAVFRFCPLPR